MLKEIKTTLKNGVKKSYMTETEQFLMKKQDGWNMIGFIEVGKKEKQVDSDWSKCYRDCDLRS